MNLLKNKTLGLFEAYGVELEYMIVDRETLNVLPVADALLAEVAGAGASEWNGEGETVSWSNELALHVIELKLANPSQTLSGLTTEFQRHVRQINTLLEPMNARLLPSGMHPWMNPLIETKLWPHEQTEVYRALDRIFGCRGHGWSNLQSSHLNLPFASDEEFVRLHAAIRAVLPLIPALTASTPYMDGRSSGLMDSRLEVYRTNQPGVRLTIGDVVPEDVGSIDEYHSKILEPMYEEIAPYDPDGVLRYEWLNSRGAIARFDRGAIEIRVVDLQESPLADVALLALISETVRALAEQRFVSTEALRMLDTAELAALFRQAIVVGDALQVEYTPLLHVLGFERSSLTARDIWDGLRKNLISEELAAEQRWEDVYELYSARGTLARRLLSSPQDESIDTLHSLYGELANTLQHGRLYRGHLV